MTSQDLAVLQAMGPKVLWPTIWIIHKADFLRRDRGGWKVGSQ